VEAEEIRDRRIAALTPQDVRAGYWYEIVLSDTAGPLHQKDSGKTIHAEGREGAREGEGLRNCFDSGFAHPERRAEAYQRKVFSGAVLLDGVWLARKRQGRQRVQNSRA